MKLVRALVSNGAERPFTVAAARISPLATERNGLVAAGSLTAKTDPGPTSPGGAIPVAISGTVPARPGAYKAQLDLDGEDGARISAPLRIEVAANAVWGALCLLLGLSLLGLIKFLSGEGDVEELARHAILERAAIHADWAIHPPPAGRLEMVARIDQEFDDALRTLSKPRGFSVVDRRIADANASLASAREAANKLREAAGAPPGALETADLGVGSVQKPGEGTNGAIPFSVRGCARFSAWLHSVSVFRRSRRPGSGGPYPGSGRRSPSWDRRLAGGGLCRRARAARGEGGGRG